MDDDQQFCLRWNNHQSTLVSVFDSLLEKGMHVDCTLAAEGQTLKAHKVVLSACSPYFESVLSQQYDKHPIIILKDVKYAELRAMMDYMYRGEVNISQDQLAALLKAAESLQIKGLSDNKPSRPPSRPAAAVAPNAHPPRVPSPPPQARDSSAGSREGSVSPTRRRKKARHASSEGAPATPAEPHSHPAHPVHPVALEETRCKDEPSRDGVEDLTLDEEADDKPPVAHNDVVRNFQWHMERSQDEMLNSSDGVRESQDLFIEPKPTILDYYVKTPFALTRGTLKKIIELENSSQKPRNTEMPIKKKRSYKKKQLAKLKPGLELEKDHKLARKKNLSRSLKRNHKERRYVCSICKKKHYKYRRNKLRHEKYECNSGPQFSCDICGKSYSQKKTLTAHKQLKHSDIISRPKDVESH